MELPDRETISRRDYLRAAVAVGGVAGLSACLESGDSEPVPTGDPDQRPDRQHAWNDVLRTDGDGNVVPPEHHVLVPLRLTTTVDSDAGAQVEAAFRSIERAYEHSSEGLVFAVGYGASYFGTPSPIPEPETLTSMESPEFDEFEALIHLTSDRPDVVLAAEQALFGEIEEPNGVGMDATISGVFERADPRRTGFVGEGLPAQHTDLDGIPDSVPEEAPFFIGFRSGLAGSQAPEDRVTIEEGLFAGGTTMQVSTPDLQLETWFEQDSHFQRVAKTFSPEHARQSLVENVGESLGASSGVAGEIADRTVEDAKDGMVGHAQKAARARDDDGTPPLLRWDFNTVDGDRPGLHFVSYQRSIDDFVRVRKAMTGADITDESVGQRLNNGILQYVFVRRRGNFLVPPRSARALPEPDIDG